MEQHSWVKSEVREVFDLWDTHEPAELAEKLGVELRQLKYIVNAMRKKGFPLTRKRRNGHLMTLLDEVKKDLKLK